MALVASSTVDAAKQFLLLKLTEQATSEDIILSEKEKQLFLFSESGVVVTSESDPFEDVDDDEFERKISRLLRKAYSRAKRNPAEFQQWRVALADLRDEDFYGLVMVDLAKIPRPKPRMPLVGTEISPKFAVLLFAQILLLCIGGLLLLDPFQQHWIRSDWMKWVTAAAVIAAIWAIGEFEKPKFS